MFINPDSKVYRA